MARPRGFWGSKSVSKRIFVIDDEPQVAESISALLTDDGYQVSVFHSGEELLANLKEDQPPSCFVVDFALPDMNGLTLVQKIRANGYWQPFVVVSGNGTVPTVVDFMNHGAVNFIEKPFHADKLVSTVAAAYDRYQEMATYQNVLDSLRQLSRREMDVLREMNNGKDSENIGSSLGISQKTVEVHKTRIFKKLGFQSTAQVVANTNFYFKRSAMA